MKNIFIFLAIFIIGLIAYHDAKDRFAELDAISSSKTPAQIEIKPQIVPKSVKSKHYSETNQLYQQNAHDKLQDDNRSNLQNSINNMNTNQNKRQNSY